MLMTANIVNAWFGLGEFYPLLSSSVSGMCFLTIWTPASVAASIGGAESESVNPLGKEYRGEVSDELFTCFRAVFSTNHVSL